MLRQLPSVQRIMHLQRAVCRLREDSAQAGEALLTDCTRKLRKSNTVLRPRCREQDLLTRTSA
jgi:hypothetical protein